MDTSSDELSTNYYLLTMSKGRKEGEICMHQYEHVAGLVFKQEAEEQHMQRDIITFHSRCNDATSSGHRKSCFASSLIS